MDTKYVNSFNFYDFASLKQLKSDADDKNVESLKVIASQLESVFLQLVMKNMQDANESFKSDIFSRDNEDFYQDMLNHQMSLSLSKAGGIGLADMIVKQLQTTNQSTPKQATLRPLVMEQVIRKNQPLPQTQVTNVVEKAVINQAPAVPEIATEAKVETKPETESKSEFEAFIKTMLPFAKQVASMIGIDPKLLIAQSALETGWGKHVIQVKENVSANNLFGIKAFSVHDKQVTAETTEYVNHQPVKEVAAFKSYASLLDSFVDYVKLLQTKRYEKALANVDDPKTFLTELQNAGYATDPQYANKVLAIYENQMGSS